MLGKQHKALKKQKEFEYIKSVVQFSLQKSSQVRGGEENFLIFLMNVLTKVPASSCGKCGLKDQLGSSVPKQLLSQNMNWDHYK